MYITTRDISTVIYQLLQFGVYVVLHVFFILISDATPGAPTEATTTINDDSTEFVCTVTSASELRHVITWTVGEVALDMETTLEPSETMATLSFTSLETDNVEYAGINVRYCEEGICINYPFVFMYIRVSSCLDCKGIEFTNKLPFSVCVMVLIYTGNI